MVDTDCRTSTKTQRGTTHEKDNTVRGVFRKHQRGVRELPLETVQSWRILKSGPMGCIDRRERPDLQGAESPVHLLRPV